MQLLTSPEVEAVVGAVNGFMSFVASATVPSVTIIAPKGEREPARESAPRCAPWCMSQGCP